MLGKKKEEQHLAMGYNASWASVNESERGLPQAIIASLNASSAHTVVINRSSHETGTLEDVEYREGQTYRHFTTTVQIVIFIGSLLGK